MIKFLLIFLTGLFIYLQTPVGADRISPIKSLSSVFFRDIAKKAGLNFQHFSGSPEKQYILESMSGGVAWIDYNRDGFIDLYLVNGGHWNELLEGKRSVSNALFQNNGNGTFTNVTQKSGLSSRYWGMGVAAGDYNNDNWVDLFVCNYGSNTLYRNNGNGTFTDVTAEATLGDKRWAVSAAFGDYDADGWLDLYVTNTVQFDYQKPDPMDCHYRGITVQCGPLGMMGDSDILYKNRGNGTFEDVSEKTGVGNVIPSYGLGVVWSDFDNDGDQDIYVANDQMANFLFENKGDGTFEEIALLAGAAFSDDGTAQGSMGVDFGDYDRDGLLDIFLTHFSDDYNTLFRNLGKGRFRDVTRAASLTFNSWPMVGWGAGFVDLDNDGWEDIFAANGHVFPQVDDYKVGMSFHQRSQVFHNLGNGKFEEISAGLNKVKTWSSRGVAFADFDNDGDMDVAVNNLDGQPWLLQNEQGNQAGNWILLTLEGVKSNRSAIGARVYVKIGSKMQMREIRGGSSYQSTHDFRVHFGLANAKNIDTLTIRWIDGTVQEFQNIKTNRFYHLKEGGTLKLTNLP